MVHLVLNQKGHSMSNQSKTVKFTQPPLILMKFGTLVYDHESVLPTGISGRSDLHQKNS